MQEDFLKEMERKIIKSFLDMIIIIELSKPESLSGYEVIELTHRKFGILSSPGTVYSLLYSMERDGLVKGEWVARKRVYSLTDEGTKMVNALFQTRDKILNFIQTILSG